MAKKINEGDVMEGIFSIACALFIADGKIDKLKLNQIRQKIEPKKFVSGRVVIDIATNRPYGTKGDTLSVQLQMRLKSASTIGAFGDDFAMYVDKSKDIGDLDRKINTLIANANSSFYLKKLQRLKTNYLNDKKPEKLKFTIIADGIEGEQTGGEIKGDVMVTLIVEDQSGRKVLASPETVSFSVKSGSKTAANLSPYYGMLATAEYFGVSLKNREFYQNVLDRRAITDTEKKAAFQAVYQMFDELREAIIALNTSVLTKLAVNYIRKHVQGVDQASLIDIEKNKLKEISANRYDMLESLGLKLEAKKAGANMLKFVVANNTSGKEQVLFQIRVKILGEAKPEKKLYVEIGNLLYEK